MYDENGTRKAPADADKIRLGQRIESAEARAGEPSRQRLLAEKAIEVIRASTSINDMRDRAACTIVIEDTLGPSGKIRYQGFVKSGDGTGLKVKLSALPRDCRAGAIMKRFEEKSEAKPMKAMTANQAKFHGRAAFKAAEATAPASFDDFMIEAGKRLAEKGMSIERQGKTGAYIRFAEGDEGKIKLSALGGKYSLSALNKRFNANNSPYALIMHESQKTVNASSRKDASKHASTVPADRVSSAQERAETAEDRAAAATAAAVEAGADGMEGFYELDFFEQISVMSRVVGAEAAARAATDRASDAEERAREAEDRANASEMALTMSQHTENAQLSAEEKTMENKPDLKLEMDKQARVAKAVRDYADAAGKGDCDLAARHMYGIIEPHRGPENPGQYGVVIRDPAALAASAQAARAFAQALEQHPPKLSPPDSDSISPFEYDDAIRETRTAFRAATDDMFLLQQEDTNYYETRMAAEQIVEDAARQYPEGVAHGVAWVRSALDLGRRDSYEISPDADTTAVVEAAKRMAELAARAEKGDTTAKADIPGTLEKMLVEVQKLSPNDSTTIDTSASKNPGVGSGKALSEAGLKTEKTANAAPDKEIQAPKRKFSFGNFGFGGKGGKGGGPSMEPKM